MTNLVTNDKQLIANGSVSITRVDFSHRKSGSNIVEIFSKDGKVTIRLDYNTDTIDDVPFESQQELFDAISDFLINGGGDGAGVASVSGNIVDNSDPNNPVVTFDYGMITGVNFVSDTAIEFGATGYYTYTGDDNITSPLPPNEEATGRRYVILNTLGTGSLTITGDIYESGGLVNTFEIMPGENYIIYNNGLHWAILS